MSSVLIVDDDADLREALRRALEMEGWRCAEAHDGASALAALRSGPPPDLILLDLMMPGMNGYEFREAQSADPALRSIPTVVVTASHLAEPLAGTAGHLRKPLTLEQLVATMERALSA